MSGAEIGLALSVFLACAVEAVEALTIVLAVGGTRSWSSAMYGAGAATVVLAVLIGGLGAALVALPIDAIRAVLGAALLLFGLQWLRKAVLRAAGLKALHDELGEFERQRQEAEHTARQASSVDRYSLVISFKAVLLEGMEVALIVVTLGAAKHDIALAAAAAAAAVLAVVLAGLAARAPLARVPENTMKFIVGVMLCTYGVFWIGEGLGVSWPGGDAMLLVLAAAVLGVALLAVRSLRAAPAGT